MCGIVGYSGILGAISILIDGLKRLEYRGYDSAGIAIYNNGEIDVLKCKGRLAELERIINEKMPGNMGIGHTR